MNRVVGGKINKSKKLYGGGINEFISAIQNQVEDGYYDLSYDTENDNGDMLIFKFKKEDFEKIVRMFSEGKTLREIDEELTGKTVRTNLLSLINDNESELRDVPYLIGFIKFAIVLADTFNAMGILEPNERYEAPNLREVVRQGNDLISDYLEQLNPDEEEEEEEEAPEEDPENRMSRPASRRSSMAQDPENRRVRRPSDLMWFEESPASSRAPSRPASRRPSRVIPDTDPEGVSESIYGPDDPRPVGYGKNKNKKYIINKKTMSERIIGAGKMSAMEKKLMGMGMSGGQIKKLMKLGMLEKGKGMSGAGMLNIQHGGRKMKKIKEEEEEEMSEEEKMMPKMKGGRVAIDPFFGVISSEGGAMNFAHPESFTDRRPMSKLSFGSGYSDKHDKSAIEEDKALEMKEAVRRAGTEGRRELDRKMSAPVMSYGGAKAEMEGGFFGSLLSAAIPLIGSLFGRGMMTKEAHDELMKTMKMKEKKGGMKHGAGMLNIQHGGAKKLLGQTRKDKEDEKLGMEMEGVKKKLGEGMSGGRKPNAFIAFSNKHRAKVRAQMKDAPMKEVMKKLGEMYRAQK
jgi:hypothetical protein